MRIASTTVRLGLLVFGLQSVAAATLLVALGGYARWQTTARADAAAQILRDDMLSVYARDGAPGLLRTVGDRAAQLREGDAVVLVLGDRDYRRLAGTLPAWPSALTRDGPTRGATIVGADGKTSAVVRARVTTLPGGLHLLTGMETDSDARVLAVVGEASAVALLVALVLALAAAWVSARMVVEALAEPIGVLQAARRGDLSRRVGDQASRDAFATLGREVNTTLTHVEILVAQLKFATDAMAHDLKSPITRMRAALNRVERAVTGLPDAGGAQGAVDQAQGEATRLLTVIDTALSIARAEAGIDRSSFRPTDLARMLGDLAEIYGPVAEDAGRTIAVAAVPGPPLPVHRELLGQAIGNLIDNALKYGAGTIRIALTRTADTVSIGVADEGVGIEQADRALALRKFGRLDAARSSSGAGLGLALAAAVARLHGGDISLRDAAPGLEVVLDLAPG